MQISIPPVIPPTTIPFKKRPPPPPLGGDADAAATFLEKKSLNYENLDIKVAISRKKWLLSKYVKC